MGGMLMYNFKVKSDIHDYEVEFIDDFNKKCRFKFFSYRYQNFLTSK